MVIGRKVRAVVAGATGYSGRELIRMLLDHPYLELVGAFASKSADEAPLASVHPHLTGLTMLPCLPYDEDKIRRFEPRVIFLGTPNEFSHDEAPNLLETGAVVVDLSGAYRLRNPEYYPVYYGFEHSNRELLEAAVYGMTEFVRDDLRGAKLVANPGCYPTSIIIPVKPLMDAGLIDVSLPVICDSKSGVTGAGKAPSSTTHFPEVSESLRAYNVFKHRHTPEIAAGLGLENRSDRLTFTPHLLPINRGILSTVYVRLNAGVKKSDVLGVWRETFATSPLVRIFDSAQLPEIKFVAGTAYCDIGAVVDESTGQAVIIGAIDNLLKGAASQALQNANLALGFDECAGIRR